MILTATWVLPVTAPPIKGGYVEIDGPRIVSVGPAADLAARPSPREDLGDAVLMPGLVNAHTHLELTAYAGRLKPGPFWRWIGGLVKLRARRGRIDRERQGVHEGAWQSLRAGVTCVGDISRENVAWEVLKPLPIRKVCFAELLTLANLPPRNPAELRAAVLAIREDDLLTAGVSFHAPYTVPQAHIRATVELAEQLQRPWCTHWAETREEVAFLTGNLRALPWFLRRLLRKYNVGSPGLPPGEYLERCTAGLPPGLLAHANYVSDADIERLAAGGHSVVYCPRAHRFFKHPPHPLNRLRQTGVPVAIGTDSAAGNENLALLEELRYVRRHVADPPEAAELLSMVTLEAARALRLDHLVGSLAPGKAADLAAFPLAPAVADPTAALVDTAPVPLAVWVAGQRVV